MCSIDWYLHAVWGASIARECAEGAAAPLSALNSVGRGLPGAAMQIVSLSPSSL